MASSPPDNLIREAQAGDRQAFARLLEGIYDDIFRIAMQWCGVRADAEDIAQQASIKLAGNLAQFRFESAFSSWLYRLVINCAKDWQRSQGRHRLKAVALDAMATGEVPALNIGDAAEHGLDLARLMDWAATLGEGIRETLLLVFGEGMNHREAAEVLGIKESTVSWRIHEFRQRLRERDAAPGGEA